MVNQLETDKQDENDDDDDESDKEGEEKPIIALHLMPAIAYSSFLIL